jgi:hypothetical protein
MNTNITLNQTHSHDTHTYDLEYEVYKTPFKTMESVYTFRELHITEHLNPQKKSTYNILFFFAENKNKQKA